MSTAWKELLKKPYLSQKPQLTQGLADYNEDRDLSLAFKNLTDLEDHCKKLYKEVRRHEECANGLHRQSYIYPKYYKHLKEIAQHSHLGR